jgi:hypothetical protein
MACKKCETYLANCKTTQNKNELHRYIVIKLSDDVALKYLNHMGYVWHRQAIEQRQICKSTTLQKCSVQLSKFYGNIAKRYRFLSK